MFFPRIRAFKGLLVDDVLTLQHNVLSKNARCGIAVKLPVLTLQHNVLSKNSVVMRFAIKLVLTLQHNVLSKNIVDIAI